MKRYRTANTILFLSLLFLLAVVWLKAASPWQGMKKMEWVYFMAQSCFIGCLADYMAVESLFRRRIPGVKPLIAANRERIIRKIGEMNHSLLGRENWLAKCAAFSLTDFFLPWMKSHKTDISQTLADKCTAYFVEFLGQHQEDMARWGREESSKWLPAFISFVQGRLQQEMNREVWLTQLLAMAKRKIEEPAVCTMLARQLQKAGDQEEKGWMASIGYTLGKWFGAIDYDQLAQAALEALAEEITAWQQTDHPFHQKLLAQWDLLVKHFLQDPVTLEALTEFGKGLFDSFPLEQRIQEGIADFQKQGNTTLLSEKLVSVISQGIEQVEGNQNFRQQIDAIGQDLLSEVITYEHGFLSDTMMEVLEGFRDEELNEFVESKVHRQLEGIRVNGAIVGLAAGVLFYGFLTYIWIPLVVTGCSRF